MIAQHVLVASILIVAGVLVSLSIGILVNKALREARAAADRRRRQTLEPRLLSAIHAGEAWSVAESEAVAAPDGRAAGPAGGGSPFLAAVGGVPSGRDRRVVETILTDHASRVKGIAREQISIAFNELGYVDGYLQGLRSRRWWRRADSAERLGLARAERAVEPLVLLMTDPIGEVRLRAAKALGEIRGKAAVGPLIDALAHPNRWSTLRVADILSRMGGEAAEGIREAWPALPPPARLASLDILGKIHRLEGVDFLRDVLKGGDPDQRARAAHALGMIGSPAAVGDLIGTLRDPEWPVRAMSAKALGRIGSAEAAGVLGDALKDKEWWVRSNAANALKHLGPSGQKALLEILEDSDTYARHQAVQMLVESGMMAECVAALDSRDDAARAAAESLVRRVVEVDRVAFLGDQALEYPNPRVRGRLEELLRRGRS